MFRFRIFQNMNAAAFVRTACAAVLASGLVVTLPSAEAAAAKTAAIVVDTTTGKVLYQEDADARRYPASLTKMMTLYVLFEELDRGRYKLSSRLTATAHSAAMPPSKLGLRRGETISVEDAIKALVTKSANDVAATIGENVSGSERAFADRMTRTARAIGMRGTQFRNASGLPDVQQYTTARDMMILGVALQVRFPRYYDYFQTRSFVWKGRKIGNHNRLLGSVDGVDGIKTGYTRMSGFNLVSSIKRDGRKMVGVVLGGTSGASRDDKMRKLLAAYLPKASRGRGVDDALVARAVGQKVPVAARNIAIPVGEAASRTAVALAGHPMPLPRPLMPSQEFVTASILPSASIEVGRPIATVPLRQPDVYTEGEMPVSAAEAFAEVEGEGAIGDADMEADSLQVQTMSIPVPPAPIEVASVDTGARKLAAPSRSADRQMSGWVIQIGAVASEKAANALLAKARDKAGSSLADAAPVTEVFSKGSATYVRARFAGFDDADAANRACAVLKKRDFACYAVRL
ncbi:D-alanyl-D-alanine carboxypeptidase [Methylobrevis pamukkalensis]|uniref:D-alanyl-D-alanine carboxypeptidase DacF n=1 Tax=Methylobrevis pamukkalensis TaxID=1439726 RepID=A0A1E3H124_9HYPH|nr:D-alanyl-D-alanine carboxypeptidase [Methylobrevis pamukkalensis]ODN70000.1 D-alanyl-D-alanine carboxypeptidase DacF precursor [Methylobrevis pamukkalensis]